MSRHLRMLAAALLCGGALAQSSLPDVPPVSDFLTPGKATVELLRIALPTDVQAISDRVAAAVKDRPAWYVELNRVTAPGAPLPYDARFGVTEPELRRLQTTRQQVTVTGCSTLTLLQPATGAGQVYLRGGPGLEGLNGVSFRPRSKGTYQINTRVGTAGGQEAFTTTADDPLGVRRGYRWSLSSYRSDRLNTQDALLEVSRDQAGRLIITYFLKELRDGREVRKVDTAVRTAPCRP